MNERLQKIFAPILSQLGGKMIHVDDAKCFTVFDNDYCRGTFYAVEADENCLITRYDVKMLKDLVIREQRFESMCIVCFSEDFEKHQPIRLDTLHTEKNIAVYLNRNVEARIQLEADAIYKVATIFYLPEYFKQESIAQVSDFHEMSALVSSLDEGLVAFHLRGLFEDLDFERASKPSGSLYYQSKAMQALVHVLDMIGELNRLRRIGVAGDDYRLVREVMEAIEENLADTPSIQELSQRMFVGHTRLCETFKRTTGYTIGQYARKRKVEFSQVLLRNPEIPIKEVARRMGYGSTESFSASFKRATGTSPKAYRIAMTK